MVLVVSALAGVTDRLVELGRRAAAGDEDVLPGHIEWLRERHVAVTRHVVPPETRDDLLAVIDDHCRELETLVHAVAVLHELSPRSADAIAAFGESLSSRLIAAALRGAGLHGQWVDALAMLVTDDSHDRARPRMEVTAARVREIVPPLLAEGAVPVVGGRWTVVGGRWLEVGLRLRGGG